MSRPVRGFRCAGSARVGRSARRSGVLLWATLAAACAGRPPRAPRPALATSPTLAVTAVSPAGYHNETSVAVNPTDVDNVVAAYQVPATVARSRDGGRHWRSAMLPGVDRFELSGDPEVVFDRDGHVYALYIAFDRPANYDTLGVAAHRNGIFVNRSDDGGASWRRRATAVIEQPEAPGIPFEDKPMMATDPGRPAHLYVAWTEFRAHESVILFARSADGGRSFSAPVEISDRPGSPKDTVGADEGTDVAVGPDGTIYVVWSDSTGIRLDRSHDGGRHFGTDVLVARTPDIVFGIPGVVRANGYPALAADPRTGRLYVAWVDGRFGRTAVFLSTSDDGGASWSAPVPIDGGARADGGAAPGAATGAEAAAAARGNRFFAWLSVDPVTGLVAVGYYRELAPRRLVYELAWSLDGGGHFSRRQWSPEPFHVNADFLGDYTGVSAYDGRVYGAWAMVPELGGRGPARSRVVVGRAIFRGAGR